MPANQRVSESVVRQEEASAIPELAVAAVGLPVEKESAEERIGMASARETSRGRANEGDNT